MTEPKIDERFPDRPQSKDWWLLSEVANFLDTETQDLGKSIEDVVGSRVDLTAVRYLQNGRLGIAGQSVAFGQVHPLASWIDGFMIGLVFQQRGGHQDG